MNPVDQIGVGYLSPESILLSGKYTGLPKPSELLVACIDPSEPTKYRTLPYSSILGMTEMEIAAFAMTVKAKESGDSWGRFFDLHDLRKEERGFVCLIGYGWMEPGYPIGQFSVKRSLVERLAERLLK